MKALFLLFIVPSMLLSLPVYTDEDEIFLEQAILASQDPEDDLGINRNCAYSTQITSLPVVINQSGYYCLNNNITINTTGGLTSGNFTGQPIGQSIAQSVVTAIGQSSLQSQVGSGALTGVTPQPQSQIINQTIGQNFAQLTSNVAITINVPSSGTTASAGNVILDLNNLEIASSNRNNIGILVVGQTNVTIRNGRIRNFTQGININNSTASTASNIMIDSIIFTRNNTGVLMNKGQNYLMRNCRVIQSTTNGVSLTNVNNCQFVNCVCSDNGTNGFSVANGTTARFANCIAYNNTTAGFALQAISDGRLLNCASNANTSGFSVTNSGGTQSNSIIFNTCNAESNTDGFILNGFGNILQNCQALSNVTGFSIFGTGHTILECIANFNSAYGINLHTNSSNCQVRNNTTTGNKIGINNSGSDNRIYTNFSNDSTSSNFVGVTNYVITPTTTTDINFTTNIAE